ncbi:UNVERIFIED_CONTAM: hypothetical protein PYX00_009145 [Menopon gallinae]|uniref:Uncharacterized protein n=1 Tax=Menopon gallinae TaxID=328185 RepID=A0AAW2HA98_9NEOP
MYAPCSSLFVFVTIVTLQTVLTEVTEKKKTDRLDATLISLPINSKFWNPQLDDETNMELIGIQYLDDSNKTVIEITDKSARVSDKFKDVEKNWTSTIFARPRRGDRFFVWGLLNLLKPWSNTGAPEASFRGHPKDITKGEKPREESRPPLTGGCSPREGNDELSQIVSVVNSMRILISTLLLALTGSKKESKCSNGDELTNSFIPAGLQVSNHYLAQLQWPLNAENVTSAVGRVNGTLTPLVPVIVITYNTENSSSSEETRKTIKRLEKLTTALAAEASDQGLAECRGFTADLMRQLEKASKSTSREQLSFVLKKIMNGSMKNSTTKILVKGVLMEIEDLDSQLSRDLQNVEPLRYLSDLE